MVFSLCGDCAPAPAPCQSDGQLCQTRLRERHPADFNIGDACFWCCSYSRVIDLRSSRTSARTDSPVRVALLHISHGRFGLRLCPSCMLRTLLFLEKKVGRRNCFRGKLLGASFTLAFRVLLRLLGLPSFCAEPALLRTVSMPLLTPLGLATCSVRSSPVAASENQCKCFQR